MVQLPGREEFERGVREALRPHLVQGQEAFIQSLHAVVGQQMSGSHFAGVLVDRFSVHVDTNGAGLEYTLPLLKNVVNRFTDVNTFARDEAHRRIDRLAAQ